MSLQLTQSGCPPPPAKTIGMANISKAVRLAVGLFLLTAAGLKAHGIATDPASQDSLLLSARLLVASIEIEILLGLWLMSGWATRGAWLASIGFFTLLACASLYMAFVGQSSCGCFGRVTVSPWQAFGVDVALVCATLLWRPSRAPGTRASAWLQGALTTAGGTVVLLTLIGGAFLLFSDDPAEALARLRGEVITVEPSISDVGTGVNEEQHEFQVQVRNNTERTIHIVGGTANCSCMAIADLPMTVPAHQARTMRVKIRLKGTAGAFQQPFRLFTDDETQEIVFGRVRGYIAE